jgi:putative tryptophan/tyrosine transport system substrate-binding protein
VRRRDFITLIGGVAAWPLAARTQPAAKLPIIGYLSPDTASAASQWTEAFVKRLHELGWIEESTVEIEYRWAEGNANRLNELAAELVGLKAKVIVTGSTPATIAVMRATSAIPIVISTASDPVGSGLVANLARPGGNVTGFSIQSVETVGKRVELLRRVVPDLRRLALLTNDGNPVVRREAEEVHAAAQALGLTVAAQDVRKADDLTQAFAAFDGAGALYIATDPLFFNNKLAINTLALSKRLPSMGTIREEVVAGGLLSYAASFSDLHRRTAEVVDKILRGANPADIPVEQPTKFDLVINLKTAKALGLEVPNNLLVLADEVIE